MNKQLQLWIQKRGLEKGLEDIEIYAVSKTDLSLEVYNQVIEKNEISKMTTILIKGVYEGKMAKVKVEDLTEENIENMLDKLIDSAKHITANEPAIIFKGSKEYVEIDETNFDFLSVDPTDKVKLLMDIEKGIKEHPLVTNVQTVTYSENAAQTSIVNSKGLDLYKEHTYALVYAIGVFEKDGQIKTGFNYQAVRNYNEFDKDKLIKGVIKNGTDQLGATSVPSKVYPVVFDSENFSGLLGAYRSIFTGEAAFRKLTKLDGKQGELIADEKVNLIDDPFHPKALFKTAFDDEGVATKKRAWIENGKFTDFSHNLKTAKIFNTEPTGNGSTGGIGPHSLYLEPGKESLDEILSTIEDGIYINSLVGLHAGVETVSGNFSLQAAGFKIEQGKLTDAVDMIVVSGNFFNLLKDVEMIGNDFAFGMNGIGSPSVKIKGLTIGGK